MNVGILEEHKDVKPFLEAAEEDYPTKEQTVKAYCARDKFMGLSDDHYKWGAQKILRLNGEPIDGERFKKLYALRSDPERFYNQFTMCELEMMGW